MNRLLFAVLCVAVVAGCQSEAAWQTISLPEATYDQTFQAAKTVLAKDYTVTLSDPVSGRIHTAPQQSQKSGAAPTLGSYLSGEGRVSRRLVACRVSQAAVGTTVAVRVDIQREATSQAQTLMVATEEDQRRMVGGSRQWSEADPHAATYWADVGRDAQAESSILEQIRLQLLAPPKPAPATPAATVPADKSPAPAPAGAPPAAETK
jgi:hypothetical protein